MQAESNGRDKAREKVRVAQKKQNDKERPIEICLYVNRRPLWGQLTGNVSSNGYTKFGEITLNITTKKPNARHKETGY